MRIFGHGPVSNWDRAAWKSPGGTWISSASPRSMLRHFDLCSQHVDTLAMFRSSCFQPSHRSLSMQGPQFGMDPTCFGLVKSRCRTDAKVPRNLDASSTNPERPLSPLLGLLSCARQTPAPLRAHKGKKSYILARAALRAQILALGPQIESS